MRLGNDEAGKEKRADGGEHAQAGIKAGARAPGAAAQSQASQARPSMASALGRWVAKVFSPKMLVAAGDQPVGQRRLFDVADAVDLGVIRLPVSAMCCAAWAWAASTSSSSGGVEQRSKLHGDKDGREQQPGGQRGGRWRPGAMDRLNRLSWLFWASIQG